MLQVRIAGLNLDAVTQQPVLILKPLDDEAGGEENRVLPIWIGHAEATAILLTLQDIEPPRPMTHDLLKSAIEACNHFVLRVEVTRLEAGTYYAAIVLRGEEREVAIDARPSDSIALAVRCACPIFVSEDVFAEASVEVTEVDEEEEVERFRDFLEHVDPSDFMS
jgi:bifunctional DNase/RNase